MKNNSIIQQWLERDNDPETVKELQELIAKGDEHELNDRFQGRLEFGTAGLRGVVGAGSNRMNSLVIQETSLGLGHYLIKTVVNAKERGVVIGYDGRINSKQFAQQAAGALLALGIKVYLTYKVAATPVVAYGVKTFNAAGAVVVTASHNPPQYNGYKVYWENGAQIIPPHDAGIASEIDIAAQQPLMSKNLAEAEQEGLLIWLKEEYYDSYFKTQNENPLLANEHDPHGFAIAYTPMHGVGAELAERLLTEKGFKVHTVAAQREPDGHFPTVNFPNPEEAGAMDLVIAEAKKYGTTLACANDPDADRFAVAVRCENGEYRSLTGDQVGTLFAYHLLSHHQGNCLVGNTIVSSRLLGKIAESKGVEYFQTLTGFKWLANVAMQKEQADKPFLFAYEEALGYTLGTAVRDKDGLSALVAFTQLAELLHSQGKTIWDQLEAIYREFGFYFSAQRSIALKPGAPNIGASLRANMPTQIAGVTILSYEDLSVSTRYFNDGSSEHIDLPASDVLVFHLENDARVIVRPSGTEPKVKCYYEIIMPMLDGESYLEAQERVEQEMLALISEHQGSLSA